MLLSLKEKKGVFMSFLNFLFLSFISNLREDTASVSKRSDLFIKSENKKKEDKLQEKEEQK
jgi:hypothetical protein